MLKKGEKKEKQTAASASEITKGKVGTAVGFDACSHPFHDRSCCVYTPACHRFCSGSSCMLEVMIHPPVSVSWRSFGTFPLATAAITKVIHRAFPPLYIIFSTLFFSAVLSFSRRYIQSIHHLLDDLLQL